MKPDLEAPGQETTDAAEVRGQPFMATLARLHGGRLTDQCQVALREVVREVVATGKSGKMTLELVVSKPGDKMHLTGAEIIVEAQVKTKLPDDPPDAAVFYHDKDGGLHDSDPNQRRLFDRT